MGGAEPLSHQCAWNQVHSAFSFRLSLRRKEEANKMAGKGGGNRTGGHNAGGGDHHAGGHNAGGHNAEGGGRHSSSSTGVTTSGSTTKGGHAPMPKWALDNRAKQLNPNNFRYRGPMAESKEST
ncbi:unnamed protein product [Phytophthora fragariaefolia]|uniref:Unnamed protein product n=1 Tax=Phytophthora fragariaefolia TaxID=1490495 RepID=A0A9W6WYA1_9STRA|nr:unnamed protein product [Phytophthora fragariaefolia]